MGTRRAALHLDLFEQPEANRGFSLCMVAFKYIMTLANGCRNSLTCET
jgi:hypothetical protein